MPTEFWIVLWKCVLIGGIALFAILAVVVTIGGARDIAKLLRHLKNRHTEKEENKGSG